MSSDHKWLNTDFEVGDPRIHNTNANTGLPPCPAPPPTDPTPPGSPRPSSLPRGPLKVFSVRVTFDPPAKKNTTPPPIPHTSQRKGTPTFPILLCIELQVTFLKIMPTTHTPDSMVPFQHFCPNI